MLHRLDETLFFMPVATGKWSIAEIISITFWDRYILEEILLKMKADTKIESIDIETLNK
ncbi:hypothetical protein P5G51_006010 [Virgibacillus sp. 179-BFC.A HS]|uniref:Uncharacterized protein n=1 Tax=Tigheibacillus jepli TaxID=3035914 RepID=A0ABU5CFC8_9BACI|nr:hypothetical protein [Virgibacillus sp. 179-BFC.A HS]MDY0405013.1 hypothetical protein [Virgibacillus sp. 179-BFC.A HS]